MPSKFPCLGQKKLEYSATSPYSNGFLQSFIKLRSHTTRGSGAEVLAAYMFWSAEDASSTAMDYRKGDVEEGVMNQAGGGGGEGKE